MSTAKFNTWQNPDGTENYKCRAWVNFNGTGTVAIRAAGNVTSITDNGAGDYTVNFTTALADANYSYALSGKHTTSVIIPTVVEHNSVSSTTSALRIQCWNGQTSTEDPSVVCVAIFR
jgi:hypothetical protein